MEMEKRYTGRAYTLRRRLIRRYRDRNWTLLKSKTISDFGRFGCEEYMNFCQNNLGFENQVLEIDKSPVRFSLFRKVYGRCLRIDLFRPNGSNAVTIEYSWNFERLKKFVRDGNARYDAHQLRRIRKKDDSNKRRDESRFQFWLESNRPFFSLLTNGKEDLSNLSWNQINVLQNPLALDFIALPGYSVAKPEQKAVLSQLFALLSKFESMFWMPTHNGRPVDNDRKELGMVVVRLVHELLEKNPNMKQESAIRQASSELGQGFYKTRQLFFEMNVVPAIRRSPHRT